MADIKLGKFQIIEEIGHGGFGTVYRANDVTLDRIVALKVLHQQYLSDQVFIKSFMREARLMAKVSHPNVVQIFEVGDLESQIYIAMQYFDGGNLDQKIQAGGPLPLRDAIRMLSQTARGLEAGHKIGLVHRDVKPANILYNHEGYVAISDFGVAKSIQQSSPETTNSFNQYAGTPYYIPPELWQSEGNPSPAADVYSLACVFYEALTGEILFAGETYEHVLTRHVLEAPVFSKPLPESLVDTLNVALAKNPSDRYQTMHDFLAAVRGALENRPRKSVPAHATPDPSNLVEGLPRPLAPGEITFDELVRRSQRKTTAQSPVAKPAPISRPTPAPPTPTSPTAQPLRQKTEPEPSSKPKTPVVIPIISRPPKAEQPPEPIVEHTPAPEVLETEPGEILPGFAPEQNEASSLEAFLEGESVENFFNQTSQAPLEDELLAFQEAEEVALQTENQDDSSILDDWLAKEPAFEEPPSLEIPSADVFEDVPQILESERVAGSGDSAESEAEASQILFKDEITSDTDVETPVEAELIIPAEQSLLDMDLEIQPEPDQVEPTPEANSSPTQHTPDQSAITSSHKKAAAESKLKNEVVLETTVERPQPTKGITSSRDARAQTLKDRQGLLAHNAATSKFDQNPQKNAVKEPEKNPKLVLMLAFGGVALIALAFLVFSGQAGSLFGGGPSSTPTFTLTLLPSNTAAAPVILPTRANTATAAVSSTMTSTQTSPTATIQSPTPTETATSTPYPTDRPTDRPTNPPNPPTARPTDRPTNPPSPPTAIPTNRPTNTPKPPNPTQPPVVTTAPVPPTRPPTPIPP